MTKSALKFKLISEFEKEYAGIQIMEVCDALLFSETGFVFPVINGIPRMLVESFFDNADFLQVHLPDYEQIKQRLEANHSGLLQYCITKNKKTKASFKLEWSFLNTGKEDKIWHENIADLLKIFRDEVDEDVSFFSEKKVIDVGCGHGIMNSKIAEISKLSIGIEISKAVENAYKNNGCSSAWYIQGDLQFLPFEDATFDVLYSSGVIHHTNNTELSFLLIEPVIKHEGKICLWLYHPQKDRIHNALLRVRNFTKRLPLKICLVFLAVFIFPVSFLIKSLKRKETPNVREEIIDLLDHFTPEFRFETQHDLATLWLKRRNYSNVKITTDTAFGFSVVGIKSSTDVVNRELT